MAITDLPVFYLSHSDANVSTEINGLKEKLSEVTPAMINTMKNAAADSLKAQRLLQEMINKNNGDLPRKMRKAPPVIHEYN